MNSIRCLAILNLAVLCHAACADDYAESTRVKVGDDAPDFSCQQLSGEKFSLSEQKGKVVLVNFFATWCGPCVAEMPHLEKEIYQKYKDRDDFILISIGREEEISKLKNFMKEKGLSFTIASDPAREVYAKYAEKYIPRNFVIGKDGKVKLASVGFSDSEFKKMIKLIDGELEAK